jgi:hypothetical protein
MTLSTNIYILDPVDPLEVFNFVNKYLLNAENPRFKHEPYKWGNDPEIMTLSNEGGQGFDAWFMSKYRKGGPLYTEDQIDEEDYDEPYLTDPACFMKLDFDTAYGYNVPGIGGCSQLHSRYIVALHAWLAAKGVRIKWQNEFTGEYHDGLDGLEEFAGNGDDAQAWFKSILPGVLVHTTSKKDSES